MKSIEVLEFVLRVLGFDKSIPAFSDDGRTPTVVRPWQSAGTVPALTAERPCPFHGDGFRSLRSADGWQAAENTNPIYKGNMVITPVECRDRLLPGDIDEAMTFALPLMDDADYWFGVKVGGLAGQTVRHIHFHLVRHTMRRVWVTLQTLRAKRVLGLLPPVFTVNGCEVAAGGHRAGQCLILPGSGSRISTADFCIAAESIVIAAAEKFRTPEGLAPEFALVASFSGKRLRYGAYIPVASQFGFDHFLALLEGRPFPLGWSHRATARLLKS